MLEWATAHKKRNWWCTRSKSNMSFALLQHMKKT